MTASDNKSQTPLDQAQKLLDDLEIDVKTHQKKHIPGTDEFWERVIEKRKQAIEEAEHRSGMQKLLDNSLSKLTKTLPDTVTGQDIAPFNPIPAVKEVTQKLPKSPRDYYLRLKLVQLVSRRKKEFSMDEYRKILLQATVANTFGLFTSEGLMTAMNTQASYLTQLQARCRHDQRILDLRRKQLTEKKDLTYDQVQLLNRVEVQIKKHTEVVENYLKHIEKQGKDLSLSEFEDLFHVKDLKTIVLNKNREKEETFKKGPAIVDQLRFHTLLRPYAHELTDLMMKASPKHSLGFFLKGRLLMGELEFLLSQYAFGEQTPELKTKIQDLFKKTYHYYGEAVKKTGGDYSKDKYDLIALIEYIQSLRYFLHTIAKIINLKIPPKWAIDNIRRALMLIRQARSESDTVRDLDYALKKDLEAFKEAIR